MYLARGRGLLYNRKPQLKQPSLLQSTILITQRLSIKKLYRISLMSSWSLFQVTFFFSLQILSRQSKSGLQIHLLCISQGPTNVPLARASLKLRIPTHYQLLNFPLLMLHRHPELIKYKNGIIFLLKPGSFPVSYSMSPLFIQLLKPVLPLLAPRTVYLKITKWNLFLNIKTYLLLTISTSSIPILGTINFYAFLVPSDSFFFRLQNNCF